MHDYYAYFNISFSAFASEKCYSSTECGPGNFCTGEGCQDDCPPGICLREFMFKLYGFDI